MKKCTTLECFQNRTNPKTWVEQIEKCIKCIEWFEMKRIREKIAKSTLEVLLERFTTNNSERNI